MNHLIAQERIRARQQLLLMYVRSLRETSVRRFTLDVQRETGEHER